MTHIFRYLFALYLFIYFVFSYLSFLIVSHIESTSAATFISFHTYQNNSKRAAAGLTQRSNSDVTLADDRGAKNKDFRNSNFFAQKIPFPFFTKF